MDIRSTKSIDSLSDDEKMIIFPHEGTVELVALIRWITLFPYFYKAFDDDEMSKIKFPLLWLQKEEVALGILRVANEIKSKCTEEHEDDNSSATEITTNTRNVQFNSVLEIWDEICFVLESISVIPIPAMLSRDHKASILSVLLCMAIADECTLRETYIERILTIKESESKRALMRIIRKGIKEILEEFEISTKEIKVEPAGSQGAQGISTLSGSSSVSSAVGSLLPGSDDGITHAPRPHPRQSIPENSECEQLEGKIESLRKENCNLMQELESSKENEAQLMQRMTEQASKGLKNETTQINREEDMKREYLDEISSLKKKLKMKDKSERKLKEANLTILKMQDQIDVMELNIVKLRSAESQLRKYKAKASEVDELKYELRKEEDAHVITVTRCLELENNLNQLRPMQKQLERYMKRTNRAEEKLTECEGELQMYKEKNESLNEKNRSLEETLKFQQAEIEQLRQNLLDEPKNSLEGGYKQNIADANKDDDASISSFPGEEKMLAEEMARLRKENIKLKAFQGHYSQEYVQKLQSQLADTKKEVDALQIKYLRCKTETEHTKGLLSRSKMSEDRLKADCTLLKREGGRMLKKLQDLQRDSSKGISTEKFQQMKKQHKEMVEKIVAKAKEDVGRIEKSMRSIINDELNEAAKEHKKDVERIKAQFIAREEQLLDKHTYLEKAKVEKRKYVDMAKAKINEYKKKLENASKRQRGLERTIISLKSQFINSGVNRFADLPQKTSTRDRVIPKELIATSSYAEQISLLSPGVTTVDGRQKSKFTFDEPDNKGRYMDSRDDVGAGYNQQQMNAESKRETNKPSDLSTETVKKTSTQKLKLRQPQSERHTTNELLKARNLTLDEQSSYTPTNKAKVKRMWLERRQVHAHYSNPNRRTENMSLLKAYLSPRPDPDSKVALRGLSLLEENE